MQDFVAAWTKVMNLIASSCLIAAEDAAEATDNWSRTGNRGGVSRHSEPPSGV